MSEFNRTQAIWQQIQWHEGEIEKLREYLFGIPKIVDKENKQSNDESSTK